MKLTDRLLQEIDALETARRNTSDMDDYMHDFPTYTSYDILEALKRARQEIFRLEGLVAKVEPKLSKSA